jgi:hypothetical protein
MADATPPPSPVAASVDRWGRAGALFVTVAIFALFAAGLYLSSAMPNLPSPASNLLETVKALAMVAAGFWLGSSSGSAKKDDTIAASNVALSNSAPVAPPTLPEKALP